MVWLLNIGTWLPKLKICAIFASKEGMIFVPSDGPQRFIAKRVGASAALQFWPMS